MASAATAYRNANLDKARQRDRERYLRNREARKAAVLLRQHQKRADELGVSLEEFRARLQAKKSEALDKRIAKARAKVRRSYSPRPGEAGYSPSQRVCQPVLRKAKRLTIKDPELTSARLRRAQDETEDHILAFLVQDHAALDAKYAARRAREAAAQAYRLQQEAEAQERRDREERERLERLRALYRKDYEEARAPYWPGLDADTYATGRMFGDILETREGHPISLEHQAILTSKGVLSVEDIHYLRSIGDPEILRIQRTARSYRPALL